MTDLQKQWECAFAWLEDASYQVWLQGDVNRMYRSGSYGRRIMKSLEAWLAICLRDERAAWHAYQSALQAPQT